VLSGRDYWIMATDCSPRCKLRVMKELLVRVRDYVWTQGTRDGVFASLIAAAIIGLSGFTWLVIQLAFTGSGSAWAALSSSMGTMLSWAISPVAVPRGFVWSVALAIFVHGVRGGYRSQMRRAEWLRRQSEMRRLVQRAQAGDTSFLKRAEQVLRDERLSRGQPPESSEDTPPEFMLKLMRLLGRNHPSPVRAGAVSETLAISTIAAEQYLDDVAINGLITLSPGGPGGLMATLTAKGREYCLIHGLDT
jgi:hypothetical protein